MLGSLYDYPLPTESSEIEKPPKKNKRFSVYFSDVRIHNEGINRIALCKGIKFEHWTYIQFRFNIRVI